MNKVGRDRFVTERFPRSSQYHPAWIAAVPMLCGSLSGLRRPWIFPIQADARALPFAADFFDAMVSIDSYPYYGTDDLYLHNVARFVKSGGLVGIAGAGLMEEIPGSVPSHLQAWWKQDLPYFLHSASWWRRHWERTGILDIEFADSPRCCGTNPRSLLPRAAPSSAMAAPKRFREGSPGYGSAWPFARRACGMGLPQLMISSSRFRSGWKL